METLRVEDLIAQAIQEGKVVQGVNDPESLESLEQIVQLVLDANWFTIKEPKPYAQGPFAPMVLDREKFYLWILRGQLAARLCDTVSAQRACDAISAQFASQTSGRGRQEVSPEIELLTKALRIAGSPERLAEWIRTPIPALNGETPYSMMQTEEGRKQIEDVLGRIEHGVY